MSAHGCPIPPEALHDYFAGALPAAEEAALEEHVFACDRCAAAFDAAGALADGLRRWTPPVVSHAWLERERARGTQLRLVDLERGGQVAAEFSRGLSFLVFVLRGDLADTTHVALEIYTGSGDLVSRFDPVPFDAMRGEVLIACQRHYLDDFPRVLRFRVVASDGDGAERVVGDFGVDHLLPADV